MMLTPVSWSGQKWLVLRVLYVIKSIQVLIGVCWPRLPFAAETPSKHVIAFFVWYPYPFLSSEFSYPLALPFEERLRFFQSPGN